MKKWKNYYYYNQVFFFSNSSSRCTSEDLQHELTINGNYPGGVVDLFWNLA